MIDIRAKGFPALDAPLDPARVGEQGWSLFDGRFLLPLMALRETALDHNIALVARYCEEQGVSLAPHGKTTMAPEVFRRQLEAGAWAMTFATAWQARVGAAFGVPRIIIANEIADPASIDWVAGTLDDGPEVSCWVDSVAGVELLEGRIRGRSRRLPVCIEVGQPGGRAGVRDRATALEVARRVAATSVLRVMGVAFFEGVVLGDTLDARLAVVEDQIALARAIATDIAELVEQGGGREIILSGGGSAYPHIVVPGLLPPLPVRLPTRVVLRSGCTVTHDHGGYDAISPFGANGIPGGPRLRPALEVWAPVLSMPEPGLAIVGAGKRDLSYDGALPPVIAWRGPDGRRVDLGPQELTIHRLNDQHAYLTVPSGRSLAIGDLVAIGVRHPCLGLDRWHWLPLIDDDDRVTGAVELIF